MTSSQLYVAPVSWRQKARPLFLSKVLDTSPKTSFLLIFSFFSGLLDPNELKGWKRRWNQSRCAKMDFLSKKNLRKMPTFTLNNNYITTERKNTKIISFQPHFSLPFVQNQDHIVSISFYLRIKVTWQKQQLRTWTSALVCRMC